MNSPSSSTIDLSPPPSPAAPSSAFTWSALPSPRTSPASNPSPPSPAASTVSPLQSRPLPIRVRFLSRPRCRPLRQHRPVAFQTIQGQRQEAPVKFLLHGHRELTIAGQPAYSTASQDSLSPLSPLSFPSSIRPAPLKSSAVNPSNFTATPDAFFFFRNLLAGPPASTSPQSWAEGGGDFVGVGELPQDGDSGTAISAQRAAGDGG